MRRERSSRCPGRTQAYYFYVPEDVEQFSIAYRLGILGRSDMEAQLLDGNGAVVEKNTHKTLPVSEWQEWTIEPSASQRGQFWRFEPVPYLPKLQDVHLRFDGLPPIVASDPTAYFVPDVFPELWQDPAAATPATLADDLITIAAGEPITFGRDEAMGEGAYAHIDSRRGTVEFWVRPDWEEDSYTDATFLTGGNLRLYRFLQHGTYLTMGGGATARSGFYLRPGQWYHVAFSWDFNPPKGTPRLVLYIDGVPVAEDRGTELHALGDWTGETFEVGGQDPITISGFRILAEPFDEKLLQVEEGGPLPGTLLFELKP